jgi:hypothetical protein
MYSTTVYLYQQLTRVLLIDTGGGETFTYRYDPVYAKKLTINKDVDNVILFEFVNQEEKPVNITGSTFVFRAINTTGTELLIDKEMVILNGPTGRAKVTLTADELITIQAQPASYSISRASGNLLEAVFTNAQAGARAPVDIVNSVMPQFVPSNPCSIPDLELTSQNQSYDGASFSQWPGWGQGQGWGQGSAFYNSLSDTEYFSSHIVPRGPLTTIQLTLIGFTGTIKVQGAETYQSLWYNVTESETYYNETRTVYLNVVGWHPLLRLAFNNSVFATPSPRGPGYPAIACAYCNNGQVTSIQVLQGGKGYLAPPKINIIGNGAGATAVGIINDSGEVIGIDVVTPGSGYWPVPQLIMGNPAYASPVPSSQNGAVVAISTGYVVDIYYR